MGDLFTHLVANWLCVLCVRVCVCLWTCCDILQLQVSSMSDEVNRKLNYLHVSSNKMSDLQRLNVQLEVHIDIKHIYIVYMCV